MGFYLVFMYVCTCEHASVVPTDIGLASFQPVLHDCCNKDCGMCYPVCGMMHIKEPLLLIAESTVYTRR